MSKLIKNPKVTIVLVTYNRAEELREAITCVLNQSYENLELLIGDDCSTDHTQNVISSFQDKKIRTIKHEKNLGFFDNWRKTLEYVDGDYFIPIICDDDRLVDNEFIKNGVEVFQNDNSIDLFCAKVATIVNGKQIVEKYEGKSALTGYEMVKNFSKFQNHLCLSAMIVKKEYLEFFTNPDFKWDKNIVSNDQVLIYQIILSSNKVYFHNKIVYHWVREKIETFSNSNLGNIHEQVKSVYSLPSLLIPYLQKKELFELIPSFNDYFLYHFEEIKMRHHVKENEKIFTNLLNNNLLNDKKNYIFGYGEVGIELEDFLNRNNIEVINIIDERREGESIINLNEFSQNIDCFDKNTIVIIASYKIKIIHNIYKKLISLPNREFEIIELIEN